MFKVIQIIQLLPKCATTSVLCLKCARLWSEVLFGLKPCNHIVDSNSHNTTAKKGFSSITTVRSFRRNCAHAYLRTGNITSKHYQIEYVDYPKMCLERHHHLLLLQDK
jgi:hypothetical protein